MRLNSKLEFYIFQLVITAKHSFQKLNIDDIVVFLHDQQQKLKYLEDIKAFVDNLYDWEKKPAFREKAQFVFQLENNTLNTITSLIFSFLQWKYLTIVTQIF